MNGCPDLRVQDVKAELVPVEKIDLEGKGEQGKKDKFRERTSLFANPDLKKAIESRKSPPSHAR